MTRTRFGLLGALLAVTVLATACGGSGSQAGGAGGNQTSAVFMVPGTLGDLGFFDSAERGMKKAKSDLSVNVKTVEGGVNATATWKSDLQNLSNGDWNLVVTGSDQISQVMTSVAKQFPDQKYIMFDAAINQPNVASIVYRQNDGAFLAGVLAALVSENPKNFPLSAGNKNVGIVGGVNIPVINDFIVGFKKGVQVVDPSIKVQTSYVGSFTDAQTGYNQAASMYANGADVVFAAAGGSGLGVLKASSDKNKYSIGVDSNQNGLHPKNVLASDLKNVGASVFDLIKKYKAGNLKTGRTYVYGIQNNGVELLLNNKLVPSQTANKIHNYSQKVASGAIKVPCVKPYCLSVTH